MATELIESPITNRELSLLGKLETTVERGLASFFDIGAALKEIRDGKLYRGEFKTFEDYCQQRWGFSRVHAHRHIDASEVQADLLPIGNILPANEAQCRPLTKLLDADRQDAWQEVIARAPETQERTGIPVFHGCSKAQNPTGGHDDDGRCNTSNSVRIQRDLTNMRRIWQTERRWNREWQLPAHLTTHPFQEKEWQLLCSLAHCASIITCHIHGRSLRHDRFSRCFPTVDMLRAVNTEDTTLRGCVVAGRLLRIVRGGPVFQRVAMELIPMTTTTQNRTNGQATTEFTNVLVNGDQYPNHGQDPDTAVEPSSTSPADLSQQYTLSGFLQERGEYFTDPERAVLDVAQVLCRGFKDGHPVVLRLVHRVVVNFCPEITTHAAFESAIARLEKRGLCEVERGAGVRLKLIKHVNRGERGPSKFARLDICEREELLLMACHLCCDKTFRSGKLAQRAAVRAILEARHNLGRSQINQTIRDLKDRGILEEIPGKGSPMLKLTKPAVLFFRRRLETLQEARELAAALAESKARKTTGPNAAESDAEPTTEQAKDAGQDWDRQTSEIPIDVQFSELSDEHRRALTASPEKCRQWYFNRFVDPAAREQVLPNGSRFSSLACSVLSIVIDLAELDSVEMVRLFGECMRRGFGKMDVQRVLGELAAIGYVSFRRGQFGGTFIEVKSQKGERLIDMESAFLHLADSLPVEKGKETVGV